MRIAIDARMMGATHTRGIGRYIEELVRAMIVSAPEHTYVLLVRDLAQSPFVGHAHVEHRVVRVHWYTLKEQLVLPWELWCARADIVHIPHWNAPLLCPSPFVLTIHDTLLHRLPASNKATTRSPIVAMIKRFVYRILVRINLRRAAKICVPTQFVASELVSLSLAESEKIYVTSEGIDHARRETREIAHAFGVRYLAYLGSAYPHKRLDMLLDAWKELAPRYPSHELLLAGELDVFMKRIQDRVRHEVIPRTRCLGMLNQDEVFPFLRGAEAFVFPSSYEGFGLPPLEALAQGTPVISSDGSCLREVLPSDGVFFFRDGDIRDMIRAMEACLADSQTIRTRIEARVVQDVETYTWQATAKATLLAYQHALPSRVS